MISHEAPLPQTVVCEYCWTRGRLDYRKFDVLFAKSSAMIFVGIMLDSRLARVVFINNLGVFIVILCDSVLLVGSKRERDGTDAVSNTALY